MQETQQNSDVEEIRSFYENIYYSSADVGGQPDNYHVRLARRLGVAPGHKVLDVACGLGGWLGACRQRGARPYGVDLSAKAIELCRKAMPEGEFHAQPAETLPFPTHEFDLVTCLGSLEHFVDPVSALREMARTARPGAPILIVVPNTDFIARKLRLYGGTCQTAAREEPRSPAGWQALFSEAGLTVTAAWKDLHILSWHWIRLRGPAWVPVRMAIALCLTAIPLRWQYQISYLCHRTQ